MLKIHNEQKERAGHTADDGRRPPAADGKSYYKLWSIALFDKNKLYTSVR